MVFAALAAARLNSRKVIDYVHGQMNTKPFALMNLYKHWEEALKKFPENLHSTRCNTRLHNSKNKAKASRSYLERAASFSKSFVSKPLGKIKKRKFVMDLASKFGVLTAKNALMYLELMHPNRKPKAISGDGSLWGPGATVGANLVKGGIISTVGRNTTTRHVKIGHTDSNSSKAFLDRCRCRYGAPSVRGVSDFLFSVFPFESPPNFLVGAAYLLSGKC